MTEASPTPPAATPTGDFGRYSGAVLRAGRLLAVALILFWLAYMGAIAVVMNVANPDNGFQIDFTVLWAAGKLAAEGHAADAFDIEKMRAAARLAPDPQRVAFDWRYPPTLQMLLMPFGLVGFTPAMAVFTGAGLLAYAAALRRWTGGIPAAATLALAAPAVLVTVFVGNLTLFWTAALLFALRATADGRTPAAALGFALLTVKPQLGILIPVALAASGRWRIIAAGVAAALCLAAVTIPILGLDLWRHFLGGVELAQRRIESSTAFIDTMVTPYAWVRTLGATHHGALTAQAAVTLGAAVAVAWLWSRRRCGFDLKAAGLCFGGLLATPYGYQYELVLALAAAMFLVRAGIGLFPFGRAWLAALWALPLPGWLIGPLAIEAYAAPVIAASMLATLLLAARQSRRVPPEDSPTT